jgi:hypothetical protein
VVSPADGSGLRRVVDVFEVANDSTVTRVIGAGSDATWRARIPAGAVDPTSSGGDLPPDAVQFSGQVASLLVPFPPGSRQIVLTYGVPATGSVEVPVDEPTASLEVLIEGAGARVEGAMLAAEPPVTMEGRTFQRFVAGPVAAGASFTMQWAGGGFGGRAGRLALLALAALALTGGIVFGRRVRQVPASPAPVSGGTPGESRALARAIAALDDVYSAASRQDAASRTAYREQRDALKAKLVAALAVEERDDAV